ncbi:hypothetical protein BSF40_60960 [Pseudomonas sp. ACN5]|nr:hypothetical protein BSF40_60960 [Pseudomonas sp. ACN5]
MRGDRFALGIGQRRGVGDGAVFVDARGRGQGHGGGVVDVVDRGFHRGLDRVDRFEVATHRVLDGFSDGGWTGVNVVANRDRQAAGALAFGNGDDLAAVQRHGHRTVLRGDRFALGIGQRRGVGDGAVFVDARGRSQGHRGGVVDVVDRGGHWRSVWRHQFQVAAHCVLDGFSNGGWALVDVVADADRQAAGALAFGNGDDLAAVQRHGHWTVLRGDRFALGIGQRRGVGDGAVLVHARGRGQGYGGGVVDVVDRGGHWRFHRINGLEVAAVGRFNRLGHGGRTGVNVVAHGHWQAAGALTFGDGDDLAAVQGHGHWTVLRGDRFALGIGQRGGVGDGAVLVHARRRGQGHGGGVVDVVDRSGHWRFHRINGLEVAAIGRFNRLGHGGWTGVDVVADADRQAAGALTFSDGDDLAAVEGHGDWTVLCGNRGTVLVGQGRGVGDGAVLVDARRRGQGHRGGVVDIVDRGFHRGLDRVDRFEVATHRVLDGFSDGGRALVDVVADADRQAAGALAFGNGDDLAAVQRHGHWTALRGDWFALGIGQRGGVGDGAVLVDAWSGGQDHGGGVVDVVDRGGHWRCVWRHQF